jgi:hypothetical protein
MNAVENARTAAEIKALSNADFQNAPSLRASFPVIASVAKQSAQRSALGLGVSGQAPQTNGLLKRFAYPETPGR